jgi:ketosteroid isomerase-like protein
MPSSDRVTPGHHNTDAAPGFTPTQKGKALRSVILLPLLLVNCASCAQTEDSERALDSLVQTEKAFAHTSVTAGTRTAFLEFLADDGILFNAGPVNGVSLWEAQEETEAELSWGPEIADVSKAGDMGYTSGPFQLRPKPDSDPIRWGHFVTVWKKTADGSWKVAIDGGVSHGPVTLPGEGPVARPSAGFTESMGTANADPENGRSALTETDRSYSRSLAERGVIGSLSDFVAPYARFYREGELPIIGTDEIAASTTATGEIPSQWESKGAFVSSSSDLGFTYGITGAAEDNANPSASYLRVWQKQRHSGWRVVVDVLIPTRTQ